MSGEIKHLREFGKFRLDAEKKVLWFDGEPVNLQLKEIELLCVLTENGGEVLTKDELMEKVWTDSFVEESNLSRRIYRLRKMFIDFGESEDLIQTVPRRGYRFTGEVREIGNGELIIEKHSSTRTLIEEIEDFREPNIKRILPPVSQAKSNRLLIPVLVGAVILATAFGFYLYRQNSKPALSAESIKSIAVLPLKSFSPDNESEPLRLRITDALITKLGNLSEISVRPTNSVLRFAGEGQDAVGAGRTLEVDAVLDGRVQAENNRLRVTLQLVFVATGEQLWSEQFDGRAGEILALQDVIANRLRQKFAFAETEKFNRRPTENNEAYEAYLKGRYFWNQRTTDSYFKAISYFEEAIRFDLNFALAYSGIADSYGLLEQRGGLPPEEAFPKAETAARKALELDETLAEAHASMGLVKELYRWEWVEAEKHLQRAIELNPNYALAYGWYGMLLIHEKRFDEAEAQLKKAGRIDPTSRSIVIYLAWKFYFNRQFDQAIEQSRKTLELDKSLHTPYVILRAAYEQKGMFDESVEVELERQKILGWQTTESFRDVYRKSGIKGYWQKQIEVFRENPNSGKEIVDYHIATRYALLNQKDDALREIEKGFIHRGSMWHLVGVEPAFDSLRDDPRFREILRKMNL